MNPWGDLRFLEKIYHDIISNDKLKQNCRRQPANCWANPNTPANKKKRENKQKQQQHKNNKKQQTQKQTNKQKTKQKKNRA